jgi:putative membrane protein
MAIHPQDPEAGRPTTPYEDVVAPSAAPASGPAQSSELAEPQADAEPQRGAEATDANPPSGRVKSTRASRAWVRIAPAIIALVVLIIFIFQNLRSTKVSFFTASGSIPLALALLLAGVLGALVVLFIGSVRIVQLRKVARRRGKRLQDASYSR